MPRYGIEYTKETENGTAKFSRETTAETEAENKEIIDKFGIKGTSHEVLYTEETDIVK
jgi:thioredoxin-related protein